MKSTFHAGILIAIAFGLLYCSGQAHAKFAMFGERVPASRLIENVSRFVKAHPKDARGHYILGRLHSVAYAGDEDGIYVVLKDRERNTPLPLPEFGPGNTVRVEPSDSKPELTVEQKKHLTESLQEYRLAVALDPKAGLYWLGLGWMAEQATKFALSSPSGAQSWKAQALMAYRKAYALTKVKDAAMKSVSSYSQDETISVEAGEGIRRLLLGRDLSGHESKELKEIGRHIAAIQKKPHWVTPIIIGRTTDTLSALISSSRSVKFDLAGSGRKELWPWVKPGVGLLVWDPLRSGKITSGRQLFGSRTWGMFWRDGYEPLSALDDDRSGLLTGVELAGISVWHDRNGNGRAERGEVATAEQEGIYSVAVRATSFVGGVPTARIGLQFRSGTSMSTFDWTPRSTTHRSR